MARPKNSVPVYKLHKTTGNARCWVGGRWVSLGKYNSPESRAAFARIVAEQSVSPVVKSIFTVAPTVDQVLLAFFAWAARHYRRADGTPTNQIVELKCSARPLHALYGGTRAADFGPLALKAVREEMVRIGWCRSQVNARVGKIRRMFKWAVSEQLVPVEVHSALATVQGLQRGRTPARETEPIGPVSDANVDATLPHLGATVRGMVEFQRLTGARPGEVCILRACDIAMTGEVWTYRPESHKTSYRGRARTISIGPKARAVLVSLLGDDPTAYVFRPEGPRAGTRYTSHSYLVAVSRACDRAAVPHWTPNQLRHTFATEVRKAHGLEAAQVLLGHSRADVTQVYAERDLTLALEVARKIG